MDRLKPDVLAGKITAGESLHSNMDRLKPAAGRKRSNTSGFTFQYGSIKALLLLADRSHHHGLHSNMDRLKPLATVHCLWHIISLHSNMDRLKPVRQLARLRALPRLHSNMDRLKLYPAMLKVNGENVYIPIWID